MDFAVRTAEELKNRWRGFQPWPGAFTALDGKKLIVHRLSVAGSAGGSAADPASGTVMVDGQRMLVACAQGTWLELLEVQTEGKKRMTSAEFLRGHINASGTRLG
jgi:methionyl-tRNA formyltransferase